jgi:2-oxoglutarate dehydrogenase E2 component (dihydrolipoamide succinyltransferase)
MAELEQLSGTGREGRVTKKDILAYIRQRSETSAATQAQPQADPAQATNGRHATAQPHTAAEPQAQAAPQQPSAAPPEPQAPPVHLQPGDEIEEMDRMRRLIADHMSMSKRVSPHVTSMVEVDITGLVQWRNQMKKVFEEREGEKLTFTPLFVEAVVKALKDYPRVNISVQGTQIVKRKHINIGMATALPSGNLIVPVIPDADQLNLIGLAKRVNDLAERARKNKLKPNETEGGTFTLTNVGTFGNVMGTPVINQPQVAILAAGAIRKKPAVLETPHGDVIAIRHMMYLSLSYDHRVVDGALGGAFVRRIGDYLEQFDTSRSL